MHMTLNLSDLFIRSHFIIIIFYNNKDKAIILVEGSFSSINLFAIFSFVSYIFDEFIESIFEFSQCHI